MPPGHGRGAGGGITTRTRSTGGTPSTRRPLSTIRTNTCTLRGLYKDISIFKTRRTYSLIPVSRPSPSRYDPRAVANTPVGPPLSSRCSRQENRRRLATFESTVRKLMQKSGVLGGPIPSPGALPGTRPPAVGLLAALRRPEPIWVVA